MNIRPVQAFFLPAVATAILAVVSGVGFAMWVDNGTAIMLSLAQTGLAWCF